MGKVHDKHIIGQTVSDVLPSREIIVWRSAKKHLAKGPPGQHQGDGRQQLLHKSDVAGGSVEGYFQ